MSDRVRILFLVEQRPSLDVFQSPFQNIREHFLRSIGDVRNIASGDRSSTQVSEFIGLHCHREHGNFHCVVNTFSCFGAEFKNGVETNAVSQQTTCCIRLPESTHAVSARRKFLRGSDGKRFVDLFAFSWSYRSIESKQRFHSCRVCGGLCRRRLVKTGAPFGRKQFKKTRFTRRHLSRKQGVNLVFFYSERFS